MGSAQSIALPEDADWMRLALLSTGKATVKALTVDEGDGAGAVSTSHESRNWLGAKGNGVLTHSDGSELLHARAASGTWTQATGGMDFEPSSSALVLSAGAAAEEAPLLILNNGGPIPIAEGVRVDESVGLLIGDGLHRFLIRFDEPSLVVVRDGAVQCQLNGATRLRWDITEDMTRTSSLARELKNASDDNDVAGVLSSASSILRDYPMKPEAVQDALAPSREVLQAGRAELADLAREKADAAFLQSVEDLVALEAEARAFAVEYAGTDLAGQALAEADELSATAAFLRQKAACVAASTVCSCASPYALQYTACACWNRSAAAPHLACFL